MKPFILILLLIASGILFGLLSRPFEALATLGQRLQQIFRFPAKQLVTPVILNGAGSSRRGTLRPDSGDAWRQATQF